jgi:hypothetical protein
MPEYVLIRRTRRMGGDGFDFTEEQRADHLTIFIAYCAINHFYLPEATDYLVREVDENGDWHLIPENWHQRGAELLRNDE